MAQNYISKGDIITFRAERDYISGSPHRIFGLNGIMLLNVKKGDLASFQISGVFRLTIKDANLGDWAFIGYDDKITTNDYERWLFGVVVSPPDENGLCNCLIQQNTVV